MSLLTIRVVDFSKYPGPRFRDLGPNSGEEFRDSILIPAIKNHGADIEIDLDGVFGYGSSFLEEVFGGVLRKGISKEIISKIVENIKSDEEPELIDEIRAYVTEESIRSGKG